jgi:hypothetical protein
LIQSVLLFYEIRTFSFFAVVTANSLNFVGCLSFLSITLTSSGAVCPLFFLVLAVEVEVNDLFAFSAIFTVIITNEGH